MCTNAGYKPNQVHDITLTTCMTYSGPNAGHEADQTQQQDMGHSETKCGPNAGHGQAMRTAGKDQKQDIVTTCCRPNAGHNNCRKWVGQMQDIRWANCQGFGWTKHMTWGGPNAGQHVGQMHNMQCTPWAQGGSKVGRGWTNDRT